MPTPLANRFTHAEVGIDPDAWCFWAQEAGLPAVGVAFIQFRKALLSTFDIDERAIAHGVRVLVLTALTALATLADPA